MLNTKVNACPITKVSLARDKLWTIEGDRRGDVISCMNGTLWITQEDDLKDYVLEADKDFWVTRRGEVIVQALEDSQFKYSLNEMASHIEANSQLVQRKPAPRLSHHLR